MRQICTRIVRLISALAGILLISSCVDDFGFISSPHEKVTVGFHAGGVQTRTTMLSNGLSAKWEKDDQLAVWAVGSSGTYTLSNQIFRLYGSDYGRGFFTSELDAPMPEDTYTYYASYPVPTSVDGTKVTFNIPAVQDGMASHGVDVMIATPVSHGKLTAVPDPEDHSGMRMEMNRMMHQFRFYVPEDDQILGDERIEQIFMTFPSAVAGNLTFDLADIDTPAELTDGQTDVELKLDNPIGKTVGEDYQFACFSMAPVQFTEEQSFSIKAYTDDKIAYFDPVGLKGKNCEAGHSTPVRLDVRELVDFAGIIYLNISANNLGENPRKITFTAPEGCNWGDGGTNVLVYDPGREIPVGEIIALRFETDEDAYKAFSEKDITIEYDSDNALLTETVKMPAITAPGKTTLPVTVPYLLFEDFSCVYAESESYGNNSYDSEDRNQPGVSLDGYMSHTDWNAARFWTKGNSMRINTRFQCVSVSLFGYKITFSSYHHGRLDTPPLTGLKAGKKVNLKMSYDAGGNLHSSSNLTVSDSKLCVAMHTNTGVLDGIPTGSSGISSSYDTTISDFGSRQDSNTMANDFGAEDFAASYPTYESTISGATSDSRLVFYTIFTGADGIGNAEFNVYIDNIKIQIAK